MRASDERRTPLWLFEGLDMEFRFWWDVAANRDNCLVKYERFNETNLRYFGPDHSHEPFRDALAQECWVPHKKGDVTRGMTVWCNPPYSGSYKMKFCLKAEEQAAKYGIITVLLLPADSSTRVFHDFILKHERRWLRKRLSFDGAPVGANGKLAPAKFSSVIVVVRPRHALWTIER